MTSTNEFVSVINEFVSVKMYWSFYLENKKLVVLCKLRVFHLRLRLRQKKLWLREKNSGSGRKHVKIEI